jgi:hypothetical protein
LGPIHYKKSGNSRRRAAKNRQFSSRPAQDRLKLTESQRDRVRNIEEEGFADLLRAFRPDLLPAETEQDSSKKPGLSKNDRILELLTNEQARIWQELTGAPFKGCLRPPFPFDLGSPRPEPAPAH